MIGAAGGAFGALDFGGGTAAGAGAVAPGAVAPGDEPRAGEAGTTSGEEIAFTALLASLVAPAPPAGAAPAPAPEPVADAAPEGEGTPVETLHYTLRTDAQLGGLADELAAGTGAPHRHDATAPSVAEDPSDASTIATTHADTHAPHGPTPDASAFDPNGVAARGRADASGDRAPTFGDAVSTARRSDRAAARSARPDADLDRLAPELRDRLGRVVDRMRRELGHEVEVVETHRSQARQDELFAQGRTAPSPVVTWTRRSQHTLGRAVDVRIDGGWDDAAAFTALQRIAREEGLHTLGSRDPGHLELARAARGEGRGLADEPSDAASFRALTPGVATPPLAAAAARAGLPPQGADAVATVAEVADVAPVAPVAQVAGVAATAQIAQVASVATVAASGAPAAGASERPGRGTGATPSATGLAARARRESRDGGEERDATGREGTEQGAPAPSAPSAPLGVRAPALASVAPILGASAVERAAAIADARDASAAARGVSHLTLSLDAAGTDRIRIDLRGLAVSADIGVQDAAAAERLSGGVGELRQALERHGLTTDTVRISAAGSAASQASGARALDAATATPDARAVAAAGAASAAGTAGGSASPDAGAGQGQQQPGAHGHRDTLHGDARQHARDGRNGRGGAEPWLSDERPTPRRHARTD